MEWEDRKLIFEFITSFFVNIAYIYARSQSHMAPQMGGMRGPPLGAPPMVPGMSLAPRGPAGPPPGMMRFPPR